MIKKITCIDCPKGCQLSIDTDGRQIISLSGNLCEKGITYAKQEIENPERILASTVLAPNLSLKLVPVRTSKPIPKDKIFRAMEEIRKVRITQPVGLGQVIIKGLLGLDVDLIATREVL